MSNFGAHQGCANAAWHEGRAACIVEQIKCVRVPHVGTHGFDSMKSRTPRELSFHEAHHGCAKQDASYRPQEETMRPERQDLDRRVKNCEWEKSHTGKHPTRMETAMEKKDPCTSKRNSPELIMDVSLQRRFATKVLGALACLSFLLLSKLLILLLPSTAKSLCSSHMCRFARCH